MSKNEGIKLAAAIPIKDIPNDIAAVVGNIIAKWSYAESLARVAAYSLLGVSPQEGRLAVREPDIKNYILMIRDLAALHGVKFSANPTKLAEHLGEIASFRNAIAHGNWVTVNDALYLRVTVGTWTTQYGRKVSRKITPQGWPINAEGLEELHQVIWSMCGALEGMAKQVYDGLKASPRKLPKPPRPPSLHLDHRNKGH